MNKICLVGSSGAYGDGLDGQTTKVRLYYKKMIDEGYDVKFVDLAFFTRRPISTLLKIKKGLLECDRIVLITATRGCKILIPYINFLNKKHNKPFILPLVGSSVLHYSIDKLTDEQKNKFLLNKTFSLVKRNKLWSKRLRKISYILPETENLKEVFEEFYQLNNVCVLNNFRDCEIKQIKEREERREIKLVYLSRVTKIKGIFDLLEVVKLINAEKVQVSLDVFGSLHLNEGEKHVFYSSLGENINYKGSIKNEDVCNILEPYDFMVFPTKAIGEGTPGVISESLIAGVPVLTSNFPQARLLLKEYFDSLFFEINNKEDLKNKILYIVENKELIDEYRRNSLQSAKKFIYKTDRNAFLKYVCGQDDIKQF